MINFIDVIIHNFTSLLILSLLFLILLKKFKKLQKIFIIIIIFIFFSPFANILVYSIEKLNKPVDIENLQKNFDSIVILSGSEDLRKTKKLNQIYLGGTNNRIIEGVRAHFKFKKKIIFSGSNLNNIDEDNSTLVAKKFFDIFNIDSQIIIDENSKNTHDTFKFLKENFKNEKHLIITSAMHIQRCKLLAIKNEINYILFPVDFRANHENIFKFSLDFANNVNLFQYGLREIVAIIFYKLSGKI